MKKGGREGRERGMKGGGEGRRQRERGRREEKEGEIEGKTKASFTVQDYNVKA